jgi:hypothetical protein
MPDVRPGRDAPVISFVNARRSLELFSKRMDISEEERLSTFS